MNICRLLKLTSVEDNAPLRTSPLSFHGKQREKFYMSDYRALMG
jgi:hypothetical protein